MRSPVSPKSTKPPRAAIYARYFSDERRPASIEDQILKCRRYGAALGWQIVGTYADAAITGATVLRPDYKRLLQDAERGQFDIVIVEAVDHQSAARDLETVISGGTHPDASKAREMVRSMIERITVHATRAARSRSACAAPLPV